MRIRRYAARLLASSAPADAAPSSDPPQPAAPWLHAAADDCAICQLTRDSDPQVAPDGIKHKAHIAGLDPDGELLNSDELRVRLAHRPPVPEAQECRASHDHSASKGSVSPEGAEETATLVSEAATEPPVTRGALIVDEAADEQDVGGATPLVNASVTKQEVTRGACPVSGSIDEPQVISGVSLADEAVAETEVSEGVCLVSEAATEAADVATASGVTTGASLHDEGVAEPDTEMGAPPVDESASEAATMAADVVTTSGVTARVPLDSRGVAEPDTEMRAPHVGKSASESATEAADVVSALRVITGASLDNQGVVDPDIKMGASHVIESAAEMDFVHLGSLFTEATTHPGLPEKVPLANESATEREVSEEVSLVSEPATVAADVVTVLEVTAGAPLDNEGSTEPEIIGPSLANESTAEMDLVQLGSLVTEATTHLGLTGAANLDTEVSVEPDDTGRPSLINESSELEIAGGISIATEAASEPEVIGGASACNGDNYAALNGTESIDCDLDSANMQIENAGESVASDVLPSGDDLAEAVGSVNAMSTDPVRDKSPIADEVTPHDDAPSVSGVSGIVARSVGKSGRTGVICYARRGGKRKLDMALTKTDQIEMGDGDIYDQCEEKATFDKTVPCESAMSTAGSADIKLADIKRNLVDNSASSKGKKRKVQRFECDIDYCHMTFKKRAELSLHKKNMCTVKSCGRHFRSHKYLRRHQRIHNEEAPYKCPWEDCSMAFKWTWALAEHFQVHTGEKPYKCRTPGCSKIYKYVSDFTRHRMRCKPQRGPLLSCK